MDVKGLLTGGFKMDHDFRTVRKVLRGNIECFEELVLKYESRVYRTCWRFVRNSSDAEDTNRFTANRGTWLTSLLGKIITRSGPYLKLTAACTGIFMF